ncbi:Dihydrolipoyllysine-residue acetyltransferase component of pyruvate dehydrogenase complex [Candidatus Protochlamydia amoebophila]|uniref:pyruvate dehydrogenase complex dihydrolipoamide acetyltransferase n=1 Tax=Candidatus Protochlamydia amoebophila TaxID=362787 RepID=UPI001BCA1300|nr:pyruvate dehydrogenase complex dihydrolipoamide acetyltransferase [Candidatus Protochlamydia amoebophila]MBS4163637.1 Dihydrolipoyllysine-residue acetyltransferase component of pyruvate dehydrogenase complex [Candidatus Protochlamydia amoebophila]
MPFTLTMPKLSPTMEEGTLIKWHKKIGDSIQAGDLLIEVATDKATVEYNAIDDGWLRQILIQEGKDAAVNQAIAILTVDQNESLEGYQADGLKEKAVQLSSDSIEIPELNYKEKKEPKSKMTAFQQSVFVPEPPLENYTFEFPIEKGEKKLLASPLAKKLAKEKGLDLTTVKGTGPQQRIMSRDLDKAQVAGVVNFGHRKIPQLPPGSYEELSLTPMRKIIGQRLQESKSFIPHFYVTLTIDANPLTQIREQLKNNQVKVSINDFIVRACALALRQNPGLNCGFNSANQSVIQFKTIDIAVAVSLEEGLITPIVRHADFKNLGELSVEIRVLAQKAREGKLEPQEYKGGSFTISNLGMFGVSEFQAILNPPQAAILAVSGILDVPVIQNGMVIPGKTMNLTLSVDHRVIDGVGAAKFLQSLKQLLENPAGLLL